jgi:antitoxin FitA
MEIIFHNRLEGVMAQIHVRQLDEKVVDGLKKRARDNKRSLESEVRTILQEAVPDYEGVWKRIEQFQKRLRKYGRKFSDNAALIRADHS